MTKTERDAIRASAQDPAILQLLADTESHGDPVEPQAISPDRLTAIFLLLQREGTRAEYEAAIRDLREALDPLWHQNARLGYQVTKLRKDLAEIYAAHPDLDLKYGSK